MKNFFVKNPKIISVLITLLILYLLFENVQFYFILLIIAIIIALRAFVLKYFKTNNVNSAKSIYFDYSIGALIGACGPIVPKNELWLTVEMILFFVIYKLELFPIGKIHNSNNENRELFKNIAIGVYILFIIQIFYLAYRILPFAILYFSETMKKL